MNTEHYDDIIIGGGKAGKNLAPALVADGRKTALVERSLTMIGGSCLNIACVPSKTMVASAAVAHTVRNSAAYGIHTAPPTVDMAAVIQRKRSLVQSLRPINLNILNTALGDDLIIGMARFVAPKTIEVATDKIEVKPMSQLSRAEPISNASMNAYLLQHRFERSQPNPSSEKRSRNRGVFLSQRGWQKLIQAGVLHTEYGERYTYEELSARSLLDKRTVSRLLSCEVKVDKGTLKIFFRAFNLPLEIGDYALSKGNEVNIEFEQIVEELLQLKQQLREYDRLFQRLGLSENHTN